MKKPTVGDRIRISVTGTITAKDGPIVSLDNGTMVHISDPNLNVEKLKHPKPQPGDDITGARLKDTWWKRGTIMRGDDTHAGWVLRGDGQWHSLDNDLVDVGPFDFHDFPSSRTFHVVHVA